MNLQNMKLDDPLNHCMVYSIFLKRYLRNCNESDCVSNFLGLNADLHICMFHFYGIGASL